MTDTGGQLPFEGSDEIAAIMESLITKWNIDTFVETGTQRGATALWASSRVPTVLTIESDAQRYKEACANLNGSGVVLILGDSATVLQRLGFEGSKRILFYLDAHDAKGSPILRELEAIRSHNIQPIITIHDFQVPGNDALGFDRYEDGSVLTLSYIQPALNMMGLGSWPVRYNSIPDGAARGFCYITP